VKSPGFRSLWAARAISYVGDGVALVALLLFVEETREAGIAVGLLLIAYTAPILVVGPFSGAVADRTDQRRLMIATDVGQAATYGVIAALLPSFPILLVLVAAASALSTVFSPAGQSAVPALVAADELQTANAWLGTAFNVQLLLGPLLGGGLFEALGLRGALAINAATFVASATFLLRVPPLPPTPPAAGQAPATFLADVRAGFAYVMSHDIARLVVGALFLGVMFAAVDNVALVFLARDVFATGAVGFGALLSAYGAGMIAASLVLTRPSARVGATVVFVFGLLLTGVGGLGTGLAPLLAVAIAAQALAGAGNGAENVASDTLIQQSVERRMLGRVFALRRTGAVAGSGLAAIGGGLLLDVTSARTVFVIGGVGVLAVTAAASMRLATE
jgi:MFS family permease